MLWHWCRPAYDRFPFSAGCWCALRSAAVVVWPFLGGLNAMKNYSAPAVQYLLLSLLPLLSAAYPAVVSPSNGRRRWTGSGERSALVAGGVTRIHFGSPKKFLMNMYVVHARAGQGVRRGSKEDAYCQFTNNCFGVPSSRGFSAPPSACST